MQVVVSFPVEGDVAASVVEIEARLERAEGDLAVAFGADVESSCIGRLPCARRNVSQSPFSYYLHILHRYIWNCTPRDVEACVVARPHLANGCPRLARLDPSSAQVALGGPDVLCRAVSKLPEDL